MFENPNHQKAYTFLSTGQFRKAHTLLQKKMSFDMGGLIWIDYLYAATIVFPNRFDENEIIELIRHKPEWNFPKELLGFIQENQLEQAQQLIFNEFEQMNRIRQQVLSSEIQESTIQRIINNKNTPI